MMTGLGPFLFAVALIVSLALTYAAGMGGWSAGVVIMTAATVASALLGWSDAGSVAVQAISGATMAVLSLRWLLRHKAWRARIADDQNEAAARRHEVQGAIDHLREKVAAKSSEVERGLKQYELIKRLAEAMTWEDMAPSLEKALKHFFQAEGWALYLTTEAGELELVQRRGAVPEPRADDLARKDPYDLFFASASGLDQGRTRRAIGMPLWRLHERIGLLIVTLADAPSDRQTAMLEDAASFSVNLIFAMAKAKLFRQLDRRSRTDGLTALARRGPFEERLREEVARATAFRSTFSVLMIDIDHFKRLNDSYGHQVGDEVLKTVAARLREGLYETDLIARYGGEEFVCLLPRSDPAGLRMKAEQLRQRVESQSFVIGVEAITVTISLGIAHFPRDGSSAESVMAAADKALYAAKSAGRNRVVEASALV